MKYVFTILMASVLIICSCAPILDREMMIDQGLATIPVRVKSVLDYPGDKFIIVAVDGKSTVTFIEKIFGRKGVQGVLLPPGRHKILVQYTIKGPLQMTASPAFCFITEEGHEYVIKAERRNTLRFYIEGNPKGVAINEECK